MSGRLGKRERQALADKRLRLSMVSVARDGIVMRANAGIPSGKYSTMCTRLVNGCVIEQKARLDWSFRGQGKSWKGHKVWLS